MGPRVLLLLFSPMEPKRSADTCMQSCNHAIKQSADLSDRSLEGRHEALPATPTGRSAGLPIAGADEPCSHVQLRL